MKDSWTTEFSITGKSISLFPLLTWDQIFYWPSFCESNVEANSLCFYCALILFCTFLENLDSFVKINDGNRNFHRGIFFVSSWNWNQNFKFLWILLLKLRMKEDIFSQKYLWNVFEVSGQINPLATTAKRQI